MRKRIYKRNGHWYVDMTSASGDRVRRMLPEAQSRAEAEEVLHSLLHDESLIRRGLKDRLDNSAEIAPLIEDFLIHKIASNRYETARYYRTALAATVGQFKACDGGTWPPAKPTPAVKARQMERTFVPGPLGVTRVDEITGDKLDQFIEANRDRLAVRTLNKAVLALKTLLTWARKNGKIKSNPIAEKSRVGKPNVTGRALTVEEVSALLDASAEPYQTIWLTFLTTGMRRGELIQLCWPEVNFRTRTIRVLAETSKSRRQRDIPIVPDLYERLAALRDQTLDPDGPVFATRDGKARVNNLPRMLTKCLKRAGIETGDVSLHTCRHTYGTHLIMRGANIKVVSDLLGHATIQQTLDCYAHVLPSNKVEAVDLLPYGGTPAGHPEGTGEHQESQRKAV